MRHPTPKPASLLATTVLVAMTLTPASAVCLLQCVGGSHGAELAALASCGDAGLLAYCMSQIPTNSAAGDDESAVAQLERCYTTAGCTAGEAQIEAFWVTRQCERMSGSEQAHTDNNNDDDDDDDAAELRRREAAAMPVARDAAVGAMTAMGAAALAVRAAESTYSSSSNSNSPYPCTTTSILSTSSCPTQSTGTDSGSTLTCYPTTIPTAVCVEGLLCSGTGDDTICMYEQGFGTTGAIVMSFIAGAIAVAAASMCFFCCRERREQRRLETAAEASLIAHDAKSAAARADRQPLMAGMAGTGPVRAISQSRQQQQPELGETDVTSGENPFADAQHPALR